MKLNFPIFTSYYLKKNFMKQNVFWGDIMVWSTVFGKNYIFIKVYPAKIFFVILMVKKFIFIKLFFD